MISEGLYQAILKEFEKLKYDVSSVENWSIEADVKYKEIYKSGIDICPQCGKKMIAGLKDVENYDYCSDANCNWCQFHLKNKDKWLVIE